MKVYILPLDEIPLLLSNIVHELESSSIMNMAISGGSLPSLLGKELTTKAQWRVFLADERIVLESSPHSNYKLIKETCLFKWTNSTGYPINYDKIDDPEQVAQDYQDTLDQILGNSVFDLIFLGMGPDGKRHVLTKGHTCSLFPGHELLHETRSIGLVRDSPKPPSTRISLTFPVLNSAKNIVFVVTGSSKAQVVFEILQENSKKYPAGQISNPNITWILDQEAGSKLKK